MNVPPNRIRTQFMGQILFSWVYIYKSIYWSIIYIIFIYLHTISFVFDLCFLSDVFGPPVKKNNHIRQTCTRCRSLLSSYWWWKICTAAKRCLASSLFCRGDTNWKTPSAGGKLWMSAAQSFHEQMGWLKPCNFFQQRWSQNYTNFSSLRRRN